MYLRAMSGLLIRDRTTEMETAVYPEEIADIFRRNMATLVSRAAERQRAIADHPASGKPRHQTAPSKP